MGFPKRLLRDPSLSANACITEKKQSRRTGEVENSFGGLVRGRRSRVHSPFQFDAAEIVNCMSQRILGLSGLMQCIMYYT